MDEPLKIRILDRTDTQDFEKLIHLLKDFSIDTYIRNRPQYANLKSSKQSELVHNAIKEYEGEQKISILTKEDIDKIKEDFEFQVDMAKRFIGKTSKSNTETRYYVLEDGDEFVAFQQAQIAKENNEGLIEGWRNLGYTDPLYRKEGQVLDSSGIIQKGGFTKIIYNDIGRWFEENGVNYERTCTGINMLSNINTYTRLGFFPFNKNGENIYLEKYEGEEIEVGILRKVFNLYRKHKERSERKSSADIFEELQAIPELDSLNERQKNGLVRCFLKEDEKTLVAGNPFTKEVTARKFSEEEIDEGTSNIPSEQTKKAKERTLQDEIQMIKPTILIDK